MNNKKICFVTVGTTSFDELIKVIDTDLIQDLLSKKFGVEELRIQYGRGEYLPNKDKNSFIESFRFKDTLKDEMNNASLIISHAGAGSVVEALRLGKPLIVVVNNALMDNHQIELAQALKNEKYLAFAEDPSKLEQVLNNFDILSLKKYPSRNTQSFARMLDEELNF